MHDAPTLVPELAIEDFYMSVPRFMFMSCRCFFGDCSTQNGKPLVTLLSDAYGWPFMVIYVLSMIFVIFGLFNLIVAVYVEKTMEAAKMNSERDRDTRRKESMRVARITRRLLKKFCSAYRLSVEMGTSDTHERATIFLRESHDDDIHHSMLISKEVFMLTIQDPEVQKLMDQLDIPPDRASLFSTLDADCSGDLEIRELITGFLQVRGEARKSDVLACLLAVRATQKAVRDLREDVVAAMTPQISGCPAAKPDVPPRAAA